MAGFEPTRAEPIGFQVQRLNHSATTAIWNLSQKISWRCGGLNPGPFTCKANALPLSYIPYLLQYSKILIDGSKILVCTQYKCYYWYNVLVYKHGLYCAFCAFWLIFSGRSHKIRYLENKKSFLFPFNSLFPKLVGNTKKYYYWFFENLKNQNLTFILILFDKIK